MRGTRIALLIVGILLGPVARAQNVQVQSTGILTSNEVVLQDGFRAVDPAWMGSIQAIETVGCSYLGQANAGIHMAWAPGGPIYREVPGFVPGFTYEISFTVVSLNGYDSGKVKFLLDGVQRTTLTANGPVTVRFVAQASIHRIDFNWSIYSILMAPIHVTALKIRRVI